MSVYNGMRIAMASVGDADAILVMNWEAGIQTNILIDSGTKSDYPTVKKILKEFGISILHHVINSHPHADHQGGLIELAKDAEIVIVNAWMHLPWCYLDFTKFSAVLTQAGERKRAKQLRNAFISSLELHELFEARGLTVVQPFTGTKIGPFTVVGPTERFYSDRLHEFDELNEIIAEDEWRKKEDENEHLAELLESLDVNTSSSNTLDANPITEPENNTSTILAANVDGKIIILTGDAGAPALLDAAGSFQLGACEFMQIPHHGSKHNITSFLIEHFKPKKAFVSAVGNRKHPSRAVVNAFKSVGTQVYSTHYPSTLGIAQSYGTTPQSAWNGSATAMYEA